MSYAHNVVGFENTTGNPFARNPMSSAMGNGQFIDSTWLNLVRQHRAPDILGMDRDQVLALRGDPTWAAWGINQYGEDNAKILRAQGLADGPGERQLAHFLGPGGAARVLQAPPETPIRDLVSAEEYKANEKFLEGKTAGSLAQTFRDKQGQASQEITPDLSPLLMGSANTDTIAGNDGAEILAMASTLHAKNRKQRRESQRTAAAAQSTQELAEQMMAQPYAAPFHLMDMIGDLPDTQGRGRVPHGDRTQSNRLENWWNQTAMPWLGDNIGSPISEAAAATGEAFQETIGRELLAPGLNLAADELKTFLDPEKRKAVGEERGEKIREAVESLPNADFSPYWDAIKGLPGMAADFAVDSNQAAATTMQDIWSKAGVPVNYGLDLMFGPGTAESFRTVEQGIAEGAGEMLPELPTVEKFVAAHTAAAPQLDPISTSDLPPVPAPPLPTAQGGAVWGTPTDTIGAATTPEEMNARVQAKIGNIEPANLPGLRELDGLTDETKAMLDEEIRANRGIIRETWTPGRPVPEWLTPLLQEDMPFPGVKPEVPDEYMTIDAGTATITGMPSVQDVAMAPGIATMAISDDIMKYFEGAKPPDNRYTPTEDDKMWALMMGALIGATRPSNDMSSFMGNVMLGAMRGMAAPGALEWQTNNEYDTAMSAFYQDMLGEELLQNRQMAMATYNDQLARRRDREQFMRQQPAREAAAARQALSDIRAQLRFDRDMTRYEQDQLRTSPAWATYKKAAEVARAFDQGFFNEQNMKLFGFSEGVKNMVAQIQATPGYDNAPNRELHLFNLLMGEGGAGLINAYSQAKGKPAWGAAGFDFAVDDDHVQTYVTLKPGPDGKPVWSIPTP